MFPFDDATAQDDDLIVLTAYAAAEKVAESARKSREAAVVAVTESAQDVVEETEASAEVYESADGACEDSLGQNGATPKVRRQTWVARLRQIDGVTHDRMAPIHGRLIAHGLLQFQLQGREDGVVYRVTTAGRKLLMTAPVDGQAESEAA